MIPPFTYFFEGTPEVPEKYIDRFERGNCSIGENARGPNDKHGILVAPFGQSICVVDKNQQHWEQIDDKVWLGTLKKVDPEIFKREKLFYGYEVELADGKNWLIPVANPYLKTCSLPIIYRWRWCPKAKQRQMYHAVENEFQEISEKAGEIGLQIYNQGLEAAVNQTDLNFDFEMDDNDAAEFLYRVVNVNYNISFLEFQSLGVFSQESFERMFACLIDYSGIKDAIKDTINNAIESRVLSKKNSRTDAGEKGSSKITNPQSQT